MESQVGSISSPVMVLGISGSGKKEGTTPSNQPPSNPRKISASPTERVPSRVVARIPQSATTTTPSARHKPLEVSSLGSLLPDREIKTDTTALHSPSMRDWNVFEKPSSLRADAADAIAHAQAALAAQAAPFTAAVLGTMDVKVSSKKLSLHHPQSPKAESQDHSRRQPPEASCRSIAPEARAAAAASVSTGTSSCIRNRSNYPNSGSGKSTPAPSTEDCTVDTSAPHVADLVALYESAATHDVRSNGGTSPVVVQKKSPASHPVTSKQKKNPKLSPRSAAASASSLLVELRSASELAVKSGSSASMLQLYPPNAVWNQDASTVVRETYTDSTIHAMPLTAGPSPKSQPAPKAPLRTPLKASAADHAHTPVVSGPSVLPLLAAVARRSSR
jgi:hypothetical protein